MAPVVAAEVVVVAELAIIVAGLPITRRLHAALERTVMQHRQIECAAVPGDQVGRVLLDAFKKASQQLALVRVEVAQAPEAQLLARAQQTADRHHALLDVRQKIAPGALTLVRKHRLGYRRIIEILEPIHAATELHIRHGFDVEHQAIHRCTASEDLSSTATATTSPASSVSVTWPSPIPRRWRICSPRAE